MTENIPFDAADWSAAVGAAPSIVRQRQAAGPQRSAAQVVDAVVTLAAASIGDGAVFWSARVEGERHVRVCHPDGALARLVKSGLGWTDRFRLIVESGGDPCQALRDDLRDALRDVAVVHDNGPAVAVVPVRAGGQRLGYLGVFSSRPDAGYGADDQALLQQVADTAATALLHAERRTAGSSERGGGTGVVDDRAAEAGGHTADERRLVDRMAELEDEERHNLGEAIHDAPIQQIVTGVVRLEYLRSRVDEHGRHIIDEVTDLLEESLDWLRSLIVVSLTPPDLNFGIGPALGYLARQVLAGTGTRVRVVGPAHVDLHRSAKLAVYRIFREGLMNVSQHAAADLVVIRVDPRPDSIDISLRDNGVGGVDARPPGSRGLSLMTDRAHHQGAELVIDSPLGGGTTLTVRFARPGRQLTPGALAAFSLAAPPRPPRTAQRVLVSDDQQDLRAAVRLVLADNPELDVIGEAPDGASCLDHVRRTRPDVLIMDVSMPGGGPTLVRSVLDIHPDCHIIVFSGRADAATQEAMLEAGAEQYVVKSGRLRLLLDALSRVT